LLQRVEARARNRNFVAEIDRDALDFALDLRFDVNALGAHGLHGRVRWQVAVFQVGLTPGDVGFPVAQIADGFRVDGVADALERGARLAELLQLAEARFALGQVGLRLQHLRLHVGNLLLDQRRALRRHEAGLYAERLSRAFLGLDVFAQFGQTARQPRIGALGGVDALVDLAGDVNVGVGVGDQLGALGIVGPGGHFDHVGHAAAADVNRAREAAGDFVRRHGLAALLRGEAERSRQFAHQSRRTQ